MQPTIPIYIESTGKRAFAGAIEWPGWCRGGRNEDQAIEALVAYGPRYAHVARRAGMDPAVADRAEALHVVQHLPGGASTDYGVPSLAPAADERPLDGAELARLEALLRAAWETFADTADRAADVPLRLGPRGGGRDLEKIEEHVRMAEEAYLIQLGARPPSGAASATAGQVGRRAEAVVMTPLRTAMLAAIEARARDTPIDNPSGTKKRWLPRYVVRRTAWHALDHAWEIEDRMMSDGG